MTARSATLGRVRRPTSPANLSLRLLGTCLERNDRDCAVLSTLTKWLETGFWSSQLSWRALIFLYTTGRSANTASPTIGRMIWGSKMMPRFGWPPASNTAPRPLPTLA